VSEAVLIEGIRSFHILNYNSPGATGAPAFSAYVVRNLIERGFLFRGPGSRNQSGLNWDFDEASEL
jgi:(S)-2-hydroxyglutarate dehydrogenase